MKDVQHDLVKDLKEMLADAVKSENYANVVKFARYLSALDGKEEAPVEKRAGRKPQKAEKAAKAPKEPKAKKAKKAKAAPGKRGAKKFEIGTELVTHFKGAEFHITVAEGGYTYEGEAFSALSQIIDRIAGKSQANHLRYIGNWKPVAAE